MPISLPYLGQISLALSQADAYFQIQVDFETAWMARMAATNPDMLIVDTIEGTERVPPATHPHLGEEDPEAEAHAKPQRLLVTGVSYLLSLMVKPLLRLTHSKSEVNHEDSPSLLKRTKH